MAKEASINYDKENDILYVFTGENVSDSVDFDNFVIDFSHDGMIIGVEIMNASEFASQFNLLKNSLSQVKKASLSIIQGKEYALIKIMLFLQSGENQELTVPSPVPQKISG